MVYYSKILAVEELNNVKIYFENVLNGIPKIKEKKVEKYLAIFLSVVGTDCCHSRFSGTQTRNKKECENESR